MKKNLIILVLFILILALVLFLALDLHNKNERNIISTFRSHQKDIALQISKRIEMDFIDLAKDVHLLSLFISNQKPTPEEIDQNLKESLSHLQKKHVVAISVINSYGRIEHSTNKKAIGLNYEQSDCFKLAKTKNDNDSMFISDLIDLTDENTKQHNTIILISSPIVRCISDPSNKKGSKKFLGVMLFSLDLKQFFEKQISFVDADLRHQQAWVMDKNGMLLFNSSHPEMTLRNFQSFDETCKQCHYSFDYIENMHALNEGLMDYQTIDGPKKLAAFYQIKLLNASWMVVANTSFDSIVSSIDKNFSETLLLLGIIILALISSFAFVYLNYRSKIRLQEETKQLREKDALKKQIKLSEERYQTIVETSHDIIWILDREGNFTFINKRGEEISGYEISSLIGKHFSPLIVSENLPYIQKVFENTLSGNPQSYEVRILNNMGKTLILSVNTVPLYEGNKITGTVSFGRDITESKKAEEQISRLAYALKSVTECVCITDLNDNILFVNAAFETTYGYTEDELVGKHISILRPDNSPKEVNQILPKTLEGEWRGELINRRKDGSEFPIFLSTSLIRDNKNNIIALIGVATDITEQKIAEEQLQKHYKELSILHTIDNAVSQSLEFDEILKIALDKTLEFVDTDKGGIYLLQEDGVSLQLALTQGLSDNFINSLKNLQLKGSISGKSIIIRKPIILNVKDHPTPKICDVIKKEGIEFIAVIPLLMHNKIYGTIVVGTESASNLTRDKSGTLQSIGTQISMALYNASILKKERRRTILLLTLTQISQKISEIFELKELLNSVVSLIHESFQFQYVTIALLDEEKNMITLPATAGIESKTLSDFHIRVEGKGIVPWVLRTGQSLLSNDVSKELRYMFVEALKDTRSELAVPIQSRNKVLGILDIQSDKLNAFTEDDLAIVELMGKKIGIAIENAFLFEEINETKNYLSNLINHANALIIVWNNEKKITLFNNAFEKFSGYNNQEVLGKDLDILFCPSNRDDILKTIDLTTKGERWETVEIPIKCKNGSRRIALWNSANILDNDNNVISTIAQGQDITDRKLAEDALQKSKEKLSAFMNSATDAFTIWDSNLNLVELNQTAINYLPIGTKKNDVIGKNLQELEPSSVPSGRYYKFLNIIKSGETFCEDITLQLEHPPAKNLTIDLNVRAFKVGDGLGLMTTDITERKQAEESIIKINRLYSVTSLINQMIVRVQDREKLFCDACKIAVEYGKFRMAWIGLVDKEIKVVKPVAWDGFEDGYLSKIKISTEDITNGGGLTGSVIREGKYFICNDITNDPIMETLREETLKRKYLSVIALPIKLHDDTIGVFHLYSSELNFFDEDEIRLLEEVSADVTYAIESIQKEEMRKQVQDALSEAEERFRTVFENTVVGLYRTTLSGQIILANPALINMLGYSTFDELAKLNLEEGGFASDFPRSVFKEKIEKEGKVVGLESAWIKADGSIIYLRESARTILDERGNPIYYEGVVEDISKHKRAELLQNAVFQISQSADKANSSEELFKSVHEIISTVMPANNFFIALYDEEKDILSFPYFVDEVDTDVDISPVKPGKQLTSYVLRTGKSLLCDEATDKKLRDSGEVELIGVQSPIWVGVPLIIDDKTIGVMVVQHYTDPDAYGERELKMLEYVSSQFARTIDRKLKEEAIKESEEKYRKLVEYSPFAIAVHQNGRFVYVNRAAVELIGANSADDLIGKATLDIMHPDYKKIAMERIQQLYSGKESVPTYEEKFIRFDGRIIDVDVTAIRIIYQGHPSVQVIVHDITEKKKIVGEILKAKEKAEEMNRLKSNFLANMSHELRTPMIGILGFSEIMRDESDISEMKNMAQTIYSSANRLMETLNQILDLSRIEADKHQISTKAVSIADTVLESVKLYQPFASSKNLTLQASIKDKKVVAILDEKIFFQIINNLIKNAIKFTEKGTVTVEVDKERIDNKQFAILRVIDTGIGISKEYHKIIFEEFRQVSEGLSRAYEGTGLGLTITKRYVESLGGEISLNSEVGKGSSFSIRFPAVSDNLPATELVEPVLLNDTEPEVVEKKYSVLMVEDDLTSINVTKRFLEGMCSIDVVSDGEIAIKMAAERKYDAFFIDISLGKNMNGIQVVKEIKKIPGYKNSPFIAITAFAMEGDKERFLSEGCSHYLSKPFDRKTLVDLINRVLHS